MLHTHTSPPHTHSLSDNTVLYYLNVQNSGIIRHDKKEWVINLLVIQQHNILLLRLTSLSFSNLFLFE